MLVLAAAAVAIDEEQLQRVQNRRADKEMWVRAWLIRRPLQGHYDNLMRELNREDRDEYVQFLRVTPEFFMELLEVIGPFIQKNHTNFRLALDAGLKLAITLRFIGSGCTYRHLKYDFRVGANTICSFIPEVCDAIFTELAGEHLRCPSTPEEWRRVADEFTRLWQFHNCLGAVDGKHVEIKAPACTGTFFLNYKGYFSIVLMALANKTDSRHFQFLYFLILPPVRRLTGDRLKNQTRTPRNRGQNNLRTSRTPRTPRST